MRVCFFTLTDDRHYYLNGTPLFANSFKRFHPDVDLVIFRQDTIDKVMVNGLNFYNSTPAFAKLLTDKYDLVVKMDADHVVTARLDAILAGDYDVACPTNLNDYENMTFENVTKEMYLQGGLVASTNKDFWNAWEEANKKAMEYRCQENDALNKVVYSHPEWKLKILDKDYGYYGCKSLNREPEMCLEGKKVMLRGEQVYAYHSAKGGRYPKLDFDRMGFPSDVRDYMEYICSYGQSTKYCAI